MGGGGIIVLLKVNAPCGRSKITLLHNKVMEKAFK